MNETIYLAGGCFWGLQKYLDDEVDGIISTEVGYANGYFDTVTYREVCETDTGFCEAVKVIYDTDKISLDSLLNEYYYTIDPTSVNRQGNDTGSQYRTGIYYTTDEQKPVIEASLAELQKSYNKKIAVECLPITKFISAELYHQKYLDKNPYGYCHINFDKIRKLKAAIVDPSLYEKKSAKQLKEILSEKEYAVTQNNEDDAPYGKYSSAENRKGIYTDITTGEPLFSSSDKIDGQNGYPCFSKPIDPNVITEIPDFDDEKVKIISRVGKSYLGYYYKNSVYIINGSSMCFVPYENMESEGYGYLLKNLNFC